MTKRSGRARWLVRLGPCLFLLALASCGSSGFCSTHTCIANFDNGRGSIVRCADGEWSHSGGLPGACSGHGGETGGGSSFGPPSNPEPPPPPSSGGDFCSTHPCIP